MLKKVVFIAIAITLASCGEKEVKNYASLSGKIANHLGKDGSIRGEGYRKEIKIAKDGTFSDTLHLSEKGAVYVFSDGNEYTQVFLKNGDNIKLTLDTKEFDETVKFSGDNSGNSNYLAKKSLLQETLLTGSLFDLNEKDFSSKLDEITAAFKENLSNSNNLDKGLVDIEEISIKSLKTELLKQHKGMKAEKERYASFIGKPSPNFENYENYNGGKTSLKDLKGKYVYVDVWATWCGPCKAEIPFLKKLEEEYHDKNITFLSLSIDDGSGYKGNSKELAKAGWRKMIKEKKMKGVQLFADNGWKSEFVKAYKINGIPRFILIDPNGNVVDANTSRPSSAKTKEMFNKLLK